MTTLSTSQITPLTLYAKALELKQSAVECKHIFKLDTIETIAVTQLREGINTPYLYGVVAWNNVLFPDIITEDMMKRIKKYAEYMNIEFYATSMTMQYGTISIAVRCNHITTRNNQEDFQGEGDNTKTYGVDIAVVDVQNSNRTSIQAQIPFQCFYITYELKRKRCKADPYNRANRNRKKLRMKMMSWGEAYNGLVKKIN
ncbi:MAG: hypothetical protein EZS28_035011 [Streblomastix strix]|uniref:Uncharacterized protein n=1 Tax=Streblomastix strix TaxID=222440 RepID=A0A5J4UH16_9EUKA|nr:MAG: hypothetical protein EZS28_035011 [Streblomastix strix]